MGQFLLGFVVGAAVGAAAVLVLTPRSGTETRGSISEQLRTALEAGRKATAQREQELWSDFRLRMQAAPQPRKFDEPGSEFYSY
ncbi:MAG: YtxH domain-containing protein [Chloroflexaceae bacterium]|jgi:gas vesicle protein|nr:YtxH domain-containing protein [Chloroflexaceae bacterium]